MSYKRIPEVPRAERTYWSAERGGRVWQMVGGKKVKKFSYSPFTAKAYQKYTFYADVEMEKEIESPPGSGKKVKHFVVPAYVGTYLEFRDAILSGEVVSRLEEIVEVSGGGLVVDVGYWRNRGERSDEIVEGSS